MKLILFTTLLLTLLKLAHASAYINSVRIDGDTVYFTTTALKSHSIPSCVNLQNEQLWSFSLNNHSGRAQYTLIVTAAAKNSPVTVYSANDCQVTAGVERVSSIEIMPSQPQQSPSSSQTGQLYLYKGDGETYIGTIVGSPSENTVLYSDIDDPTSQVRKHVFINTENLYFSGKNCTGYAFVNKSEIKKTILPNGNIYKVNGTQFYTQQSLLINQGQCLNRNVPYETSGYRLVPSSSELCGTAQCKIKTTRN